MFNCKGSREVGMSGETPLEAPRAVRRGIGAPGMAAEFPLQAVVQPRVRQLCSCSPWGSMVEQRFLCSPGRSPGQSSECSQKQP